MICGRLYTLCASQAGTNEDTSIKRTVTQPMLPLAELMTRLGHEQRRLNLLKIDCEGCEWASLSVVPGDIWARIDQISFETHYGKELLVDSSEAVADVAAVADALRASGLAEWRSDVREGYPHHRVLYDELAQEMPAGLCCRLVGYLRQ